MDILNNKKVASLEDQVKDLTSKLEQMTNLYHKANNNYVAAQALMASKEEEYKNKVKQARLMGDTEYLKRAIIEEQGKEEITDYTQKLEHEVSVLLAYIKANIPNAYAYGVGKFIRR
jgi:hypothetical protein